MIKSFDQARVVSIDKNKGRVTLFTKNGLVSVGTYLHDINDLREGMTVLIGDLEGSKVILDKVSANPKNCQSISTVISSSPFIFKISVNELDNYKFTLPLSPEGTYNFNVNWGDGSTDYINNYGNLNKVHYYPSEGKAHTEIYTVSITGTLKGWIGTYFGLYDDYDDYSSILDIIKWGCFNFENFDVRHPLTGEMMNVNPIFFDCQSLGIETGSITAIDIPNLSKATGLGSFFQDCRNLVSVPNLDKWDVSTITTMESMFTNAFKFNQDISNWNVSNVTNMNDMFYIAQAFNQPIGSWDISNVTSMFRMFASSSFDQDISNWNISKVENMYQMFLYSAFSTENYEKLLVGWSDQNVQSNVRFHAGSAKYHASYASYKQILVNKGWQITDGGQI